MLIFRIIICAIFALLISYCPTQSSSLVIKSLDHGVPQGIMRSEFSNEQSFPLVYGTMVLLGENGEHMMMGMS